MNLPIKFNKEEMYTTREGLCQSKQGQILRKKKKLGLDGMPINILRPRCDWASHLGRCKVWNLPDLATSRL